MHFFPHPFTGSCSCCYPRGQPVSAMGRSVASYSGHILKLVPGDFQWSLPQFPIVIVWNGSDTFMPTQFVKANAVTDWKMGVIGRHFGEAIKLFEEVEEDVVHSHKPALLKSFRNLRNSTIVTDMLLGDTVAGHSQNIPPVSYGPKKGTSTHLTYHVDPHYIPQAEFRHDVNPDVLNVPGMPAKSSQMQKLQKHPSEEHLPFFQIQMQNFQFRIFQFLLRSSCLFLLVQGTFHQNLKHQLLLLQLPLLFQLKGILNCSKP